jgi:BirA family biotin operon repressor/biotin-[acetyl-CoA-carboxylase] ligase
MLHYDKLLNILDTVDSTNNYAMQKVYAGMAKHGEAYFSAFQNQGKGQRGKDWLTEQGKNIALSVIVSPFALHNMEQFYLSAAVALGCHDFFSVYAGDETSIKWPNDIYWRDRKAAGILIENSFNGTEWKWSVIGIGVNINQTVFGETLHNPVSLQQISGKTFDLLLLAKELLHCVMCRIDELLNGGNKAHMIVEYNRFLYKKNQPARLKKGAMVFDTTIKEVDSNGRLVTEDSFERRFEFGEVSWVL